MNYRIYSQILLIVLLSVAMAFAQSTVTVKGVVTDANTGDPLLGANISVKGTLLGTATGSDGAYSMQLPPGLYVLVVQFIGYQTTKVNVDAIAGESVSMSFALETDVLEMSAIVTTGTRFSGRTVIESAVPIDVISAREIHSIPGTETTQVLSQLVPSYHAPRPSISDGTDHMRAAALRGLAPDHVLILINGKRRHSSALVHVNTSIGRGSTGVDMNAIPASAIERIEVLRDGAAAQYGSDAIAGVINIILKEKEGLDATVSYSQHFSSVTRGYEEGELNLSDGSDAGNYDWDGDGIGGPQDVDYRDGKTVNLHLGYGFNVAQDGSFYVSGQFRTHGRSVRAGLDPRQQYFDGDTREDSFDRLNHAYGEGEFDDISLFFNGSIPVGDAGGKFYAFGGYNDREGSTGCFYRRSLDNRTVRSIHPDGFLPTLDNRLKDFSLAAGIKGNIGSWIYDLSETFGNNSFNFIVDNTNNVSLGTSSETHFDSGTLKFRQATTNLDLLRGVDIGTASQLNVAVGAEFRLDNYRIDPGEVDSYLNGGETVLDGPNAGAAAPVGASCFPGFSPRNETDETRNNFGAYIDLENNLSEQFFLGVAARFENYSDFGSTLTGKIAGRFEFIEGFAFRGAASTGFRAPSLAQANFSSIATNFITTPEGVVPFEVGTFPVDDPVARALGSKDLDAEKSVNFSAGFTVSKSNFSFTADVYQIKINDRISVTENFTGAGVTDLLASQGIDANGGRYFTNVLDTKTQGLDIIGRYATNIGPGTFRFVAAMNFNDTDITNKDEIETPDVLLGLTTVPLIGRVQEGLIEDSYPKDKFNFTANYDVKAWSFLVRTQKFGEVIERSSSDAIRDQVYSAKWLTDLELGYKLGNGLALAVGSENLFDVYPDKQFKRNSFNGVFAYDGRSPFGFFGRTVYTRLNLSL